MAIDTKQPKGYRKAWNGGAPPKIPEGVTGICTRCGEFFYHGAETCSKCVSPSPQERG